MTRWFGHVLGDTRQADVAPAPDVHLRTAMDVGLRDYPGNETTTTTTNLFNLLYLTNI